MTAEGGVTTIVTRRVRPERRDEYEAALGRLLHEVTGVDGYLGTEVHRPQPDVAAPEYTSVFRFATVEQLRAFERSDLRRRFLDEAAGAVDADAAWETYTGLEFWFDPPAGAAIAQPVRWRMAVLVGSVVYLLVLVFGAVAAALLGSWPMPLRLAVVITVEITVMTYVTLPWLTRRLAPWIFPSVGTA